jgi:hypothetical protein
VKKIIAAAFATFVVLAPAAALAQAPAAPVTQNTVTTSGPVSSETTISLGSAAASVLEWAVAAFGVPLTTVGTFWLIRLAKKAGLEGADLMSQQLNQTLLNGLNDGAARLAKGIEGKGDVQVQNQVIQAAIDYAKAHRSETIQALGLDPNSGKTVEALRGRIATLITDPNSPTPPVLGGPNAPPAIQPKVA